MSQIYSELIHWKNGERMKRMYNIMLLVSILTLSVIASASMVKIASAQGHPGPYYTVELLPAKIGPAAGQTFNVTVKLYNVTHANSPAGAYGVEIRMTWNTTLVEPVSFTSKLGASDGVLTGPSIIAAVPAGFYNNADTPISAPPYTSAVSYRVAAASTSGAWWGDNAIVAQMTFKVDLQPQPFATCPVELAFTDLVDATATTITHEAENATLTMLTMNTANETVTAFGVNYTVSIASDSMITAPANLGWGNTSTYAYFDFNVTSIDGFCNATVPKNFMSGTWKVLVDNAQISTPNVTTTNDSTNTYVWFNFSAGPHVIEIQSTIWVPEFTTTTLMLFLMASTLIVTAVAASIRKKKFLH
jgi:hypothetical protein